MNPWSRSGCAALFTICVTTGCHVETRIPLDAEVERLRGIIDAATIEDKGWVALNEKLSLRLDETEQDIEAGRSLVALNELANARNTLMAYLYSHERAGEWQENPEAMSAEWERTLAEAPPPLPDRCPLVVRAMAEAALRRTRPYLNASDAYATATTTEQGLFYLGRARAHADFVAFIGTLGLRQPADAPPLGSLNRELDELETRIVEAYTPSRSIEEHPRFIGLNSTLKLARELDRDGFHAGALYKYLEAVQRLGEIELEPAEIDSGTEQREQLTQFEARLDRRAIDHSIGRLFLELAEKALDAEQTEPDDAVLARAVIERVLPAYFAALETSAAPGPAAEQAQVTVTLVRWPYT